MSDPRANTTKKLPFATLALVVANLFVAFFAPFSAVLEKFAFNPEAPNFLSMLTSLFLHDPGNILHILGNMVFLSAVGPLVESSIGSLKFFATYLISGVIGIAVHWALTKMTGVSTPLIGASAAVAGCVGYCSLRYMKRSVSLAPRINVTVVGVIVFWLLLQVLGAFVHLESAGGIAFDAHIGGFLAGFILAFFFKAQTQASIEHGHERLDEMDSRSPAAALITATKHLERHPTDIKALWVCYEANTAMGESKKSVEVLLRLLNLDQDASRLTKLLFTQKGLTALSPKDRMMLADKVDQEAKKLLLQSVIAEPDDERERPNALLSMAEIADGEIRQSLLNELSEKYSLHSATAVARTRGMV